MRKVLIGIQARSKSSRLPNKIHMQIGGKPILQWVLDSCSHVVRYMREDCIKHEAVIEAALLVPEGDHCAPLYRNYVTVIEGSEEDVLSRYHQASIQMQSDYIVRITSDCLSIPTHIISKHIKTALIKQRDFTTNCQYRTFKEGFDVQIMSKRLLDWLFENAKDKEDREHVCTLIDPPKFFPFKDSEGKPNITHVLNTYDESDIKTSIDTQEDFDRAKALFEKFETAKKSSRRRGVFII